MAEEPASAVEAALVAARAGYRIAVIQLATRKVTKTDASVRDLADVDRIHDARTRVIALEAAREELACMIDDGALLTSD